MKRISSKSLLSSLALSSRLVYSTKPLTPTKPFPLIRLLSSSSSSSSTTATTGSEAKATKRTQKEQSSSPKSKRDSLILEKFRQRQLKGSLKANNLDSKTKQSPQSSPAPNLTSSTVVEKARESDQVGFGFENDKSGATKFVSSFQELGLKPEIIGSLGEMGIWVPTEIQCVGIPALLDGKSVVLSSEHGSGRTLAYLLPLIQLLRQDEALQNVKPKHPRAIVLCASGELCDESFQVARFISHHAKLKSSFGSGSGKSRISENLPNDSIGMLVATPSETIQYIEEGRLVPDDIKYLVFDEMDAMFDRGLSSEINNIVSQLKNRAPKAKDVGLQTVLVTSAITKMLGNQLLPITERLEQNNAGKVAAMLLEMDEQEVFDLTVSIDALKMKIAEAMESLHSS